MEIVIPVIIVSIIGIIAGIGLSLAAKYMSVPTDEKQEKIREALPGANCGACGYSGCDGYAEAIASGIAEPNLCSPGGSTAAQKIADILGVEVQTTEKAAFIGCGGNRELSLTKYAYEGMQSCMAASLLHGGPLACEYGCIGFGDCQKACNFNAITLKDNKPIVDYNLCSGCGSCAAACPKSLISVIPKNAPVRVACNNKAKGAAVAKSCKVSCVGCMLCEKNCPTGAIKVKNNLAVIDYSLCNGCGKCKEVCKRKVII